MRRRKEVHLYFDTEFTGLYNGTQLISIGCVLNDHTFYAEVNNVDIDDPRCSEETKEFLRKEVFPGMLYYADGPKAEEIADWYKLNLVCYGTHEYISKQLVLWIKEVLDKTIKGDVFVDVVPVSDVMYYDMVLLNDLLANEKEYTFEPTEHPKAFFDVRFVPYGIDIGDLIRMKICYGNAYDAFDYNREELLNKLTNYNNPLMFLPTKKHNSLYDARVIHLLYNELTKITNMKN